MSGTSIARQNGDEYQQLIFWKYALMLLNDEYEIEKVGYEYNEVKSFDDVVLFYSKPQKFRDSTINTEYIQVKFHMKNNGFFTMDNLLDPKFINASKNSLLGNIVNAYRKLGDKFKNGVFIIYSQWDIKQGDSLYELVSNVDRTIDLNKLFDGKSDASEMGKIRKNLRDRLGVSEDELKCIISQIRIKSHQETMDELIDLINQQLEKRGLKIIPGGTYLNPYSQLIQKLFHAGHTEFTKEFLEEQLQREGLYIPKKDERVLIIRSYDRGNQHQLAEEKNILKLEGYFEERFLKANYQWDKDIYPSIKKFIEDRCIEDKEYSILIDANPTIAFMSGRILDIKTGRKITLIQRVENGLTVWKKKEKGDYSEAICTNEIINTTGNEVAVAISFARDILSDVKDYLFKKKIEVGRIIDIRLNAIDSSSVVDGTHAWKLANQVKNLIDNRKSDEKHNVLHIFMACPNAVVFTLARYSLPFGKIQVYEYDFLRAKTGTYYPTLMFPTDGE